MNRVRQLPEDLITRIAAGEVVERPASVIKELVENSLDAGARRVSVAIEGAGRALMSVSDDGCGMTRDDARLAIRRHATSKITSFDDLEAIATFGFRGEALPSIAAVSRFRLATRSAEEEMGWEFVIEGGRVVSEKPMAREPGTTIEVRDIFFNTPARFKFLKSDATERGQCLRVMEELVFASLGTTFELSLDKSKPVVFRAVPDPESPIAALEARIVEAWGIRWGRGLVSIRSASDHFAVWGAVTDQGHHQATARNQFLYINRRPVQNRRLARAIYDGYLGQLPSLRHPGWVLFLDVDPRTVDVNVHPSKREVKLTHESEIFGFLVSAVKKGLQGLSDAPVEVFQPQQAAAAPSFIPSFGGGRPDRRPPSPPPARAAEAATEFYRPLETPAPELPLPKVGELSALAQVRDTFILARGPEGLVIVDQHAAAEKVIYERLLAAARAAAPATQMLLVPFAWETSLSVRSWVGDNLEPLRKMGFVLEPFGGNTFLVKGTPAHLGDRTDLHSLLDGLTDLLNEPSDRRGRFGTDIEHRIAAMTACKAAVKAGDALSMPECARLLAEIALCEAPYTCPHGRPTMIRMPYAELEHRFRRT